MSEALISFSFEDKNIYACIVEGKEWFVASPVCKLLEYTNQADTLKRHCKKGGICKKYIPTISGNQEMTLINLPNLLRLIMRSKMQNAQDFQDWVVEEVLPTVLKTGKYSIFKESTDPVLQHCNESTQKTNSKMINGINYHKGGVDAIKKHNIDICTLFTNKTPSEIRKIGREQFKLKASECQSAKSVLRILSPQYAQSMSFIENILKLHPDKTIGELKETAKKVLSLYEELQDKNIILN
jgi:prophage antirepressor-like protein